MSWKLLVAEPTRGALALPPLLLALLPKCPLCLLAWSSALGASSLAALTQSPWLAPLTALLLTLAVGALRPPTGMPRAGALRTLAAVAAATIFLGRFLVDSRLVVFVGAALFLAAAIWAVRARRSSTARLPECCALATTDLCCPNPTSGA